VSFEEFALKVLTGDLGLEAEKIQEGDDETPDNDNAPFIELKEKDSSDDSERNAAFDSGGLYTSSTRLENCEKHKQRYQESKNTNQYAS
jgi:hypothetical protein